MIGQLLKRQLASEEAQGGTDAKLVRQRSWGEYLSMLSNLPGARAAWGMGSVDESGNILDSTGQGRTLGYNGNPQLSIHNHVVPYALYDGTGDYHARASEAGLNITGIETIYASAARGLTLGGWFWVDALAANSGLITKDNGTTQRSYALYADPTNNRLVGLVSGATDGIVSIDNAFNLITPAWVFACLIYTPGVSLYLKADQVESTSVATIPASLTVSSSALSIGSFDGAGLLTGHATAGFVSANALSREFVRFLYRYGRALLR